MGSVTVVLQVCQLPRSVNETEQGHWKAHAEMAGKNEEEETQATESGAALAADGRCTQNSCKR